MEENKNKAIILDNFNNILSGSIMELYICNKNGNITIVEGAISCIGTLPNKFIKYICLNDINYELSDEEINRNSSFIIKEICKTNDDMPILVEYLNL